MVRTRYTYELPPHRITYGVEVKVADLHVDPQAQRSLVEQRAQKMADALIPDALGSIVVSERDDGRLFVVDGMHRVRACQLAGRETIMAEVHHRLTVRDEAVLFLIKNREGTKPSALDEYNVGLTARLPLFVDTARVLARAQLELGNTSANSIGAVAGVVRIVDQYGDAVLRETLRVAEAAWGRTPATWDGVILGGLGQFLGRHMDQVDTDALATKLQKAGPAGWWVGQVHALSTSGGVHSGGSGGRTSAMYQLVKIKYNRGRRKGLIP